MPNQNHQRLTLDVALVETSLPNACRGRSPRRCGSDSYQSRRGLQDYKRGEEVFGQKDANFEEIGKIGQRIAPKSKEEDEGKMAKLFWSAVSGKMDEMKLEFFLHDIFNENNG